MANRIVSEVAAGLTRLASESPALGVTDTELLRRFAESRDAAAFELLMWRHGPLVLGTCRRVLRRFADAEDAFQATFLVLARKAGSVRGESLGGWLHRIAVRVSVRLRASHGRRAHRESVPLPETVAAPDVPLPDDTAAVLDEEIGRLPDKLRQAFVLYHLRGCTHEEAAAELGCPPGTVMSRVARARERLRARLTRRGFTVPAVGTIAVLDPAPVSASLFASTVMASVSYATGAAVASPDRAVPLARDTLRSLAWDPLKPLAVVLVVAALGIGAVLAASAPSAGTPPEPRATSAPSAPVPAAVPPRNVALALGDQKITIVDEVLFSPDGKWVVTAGGKRNGDAIESAVAVWDAVTGKHVVTFTQPDGIGTALDFSPDGKFFAAASSGDESVTLWATATWKFHAKLEHPLASDLRFTSDGAGLLTRSRAFAGKQAFSEVKGWITATGKLAFRHGPSGDETFCSMVASPDGKTVAVGVSDGSVRVLDSQTGKLRAGIPARVDKDTDARFSPDGTRLLTWATHYRETAKGEQVGALRLWDLGKGREHRALKGNEQPVCGAGFSPDGTRVVAVGTRGAVLVWEAEAGKPVAAVKPEDAPVRDVRLVSLSPDGSRAVLCGWESVAGRPKSLGVLYSLSDGKELAHVPGAKSVAFDPSGKTVAIVTGAVRPGDTDAPDLVSVRDLADLLKATVPAKEK